MDKFSKEIEKELLKMANNAQQMVNNNLGLDINNKGGVAMNLSKSTEEFFNVVYDSYLQRLNQGYDRARAMSYNAKEVYDIFTNHYSESDIFSYCSTLNDTIYIKCNFADGFIYSLKITDAGIAFWENKENQSSPASAPGQPNIFIGTVGDNAIIGNQQNATINVKNNFEKAKKQIQEDPSIDDTDKEQIAELIDALKSITENNQSIKQGTLAKYANTIKKYMPQITIAVAPELFKWMVGLMG